MIESCSTKQKIIESAQHVFLEKGQEKAKMQDIANVAGISRTSLNYYFKTKENLFQEIIEQMLDGVLPKVGDVLKGNKSIQCKIDAVIDIYDGMLRENEFIPRFLFVEIQRNPKMFFDFVNKSSRIQEYLLLVSEILSQEMENGNMRKMPLDRLLTIFYGLLFCPYLLNPLLSQYWTKNTKAKIAFLDDHKRNTKKLLNDFFEV